MRRVEQLSYGQTAVYDLQFRCVLLSIQNPTQYTLLIRTGGTDIPGSVAASSYTVPPVSAMNLPVTGNTFAMGFGLPQLALAPLGLPTSATITMLDEHERPPQFGSMPLAQTSSYSLAPQELLLYTHAAEAAVSSSTIITPGSSVRTLELAIDAGTSTLTRVAITGVQSGLPYLDSFAPFVNFGKLLCPFFAALDTSVQISWFSSVAAGSGFRVIGHLDVQRGGYDLDGPQRVKAFLTDNTDTLIGSANPLYVRGTVSALAVGVVSAPVTLLPLAARAGTTLAGIVANPGGYRGLRVYLHLTALGGGAGIGVRCDVRDSVNGNAVSTIALPAAADSANAIGDWAWEGGVGYPDRNRTQNLMKSVNMGPANQVAIYANPIDAATYTYSLSYEWLP